MGGILGGAMEMPVGRIERDFDMWDDAGRFINLGEHHQAIGPGTFDPTHVVIGCPQPSSSLGNDCKPARIHLGAGHTAVSGGGMYGKPPKWTALLKTLVQVASARSHPGSNWN